MEARLANVEARLANMANVSLDLIVPVANENGEVPDEFPLSWSATHFIK